MSKPKLVLTRFQSHPLFCVVDADGEYVVGGPLGTFDLPLTGCVIRTDRGAKSDHPRPATRAEVSALVLMTGEF